MVDDNNPDLGLVKADEKKPAFAENLQLGNKKSFPYKMTKSVDKKKDLKWKRNGN